MQSPTARSVFTIFNINEPTTFSDDWKYNDDSSSESSEEREIPPPSKRVGTKRKPPSRKTGAKTRYSSDDSSVDSDDENKRQVSRRSAAASVSYKEDSEEKTDSEDLLEVEYQEPTEPVPEEKCETIERVLGQRRGKIGGKLFTITGFKMLQLDF